MSEMTHDELLAKLDLFERWSESPRMIQALRAVVELCKKHKSDYYLEGFTEDIMEAIEKEMK
jgi:hypothetical protein